MIARQWLVIRRETGNGKPVFTIKPRWERERIGEWVPYVNGWGERHIGEVIAIFDSEAKADKYVGFHDTE